MGVVSNNKKPSCR